MQGFSKEPLQKYREVVEFHRDIQDEVIFRVYLGVCRTFRLDDG